MATASLLKIPEIAEYLGVSERWVREEGRDKYGLPIYRIGRALRGKPEEIERWLKQQRG